MNAFAAGKIGFSSGNGAMVFREAAHIQLNSLLYIFAARVSCPISDRHLSV
jgi:hypothetical protein